MKYSIWVELNRFILLINYWIEHQKPQDGNVNFIDTDYETQYE